MNWLRAGRTKAFIRKEITRRRRMIGRISEWMLLGIDVMEWWIVRAGVRDAACYEKGMLHHAGSALAVLVCSSRNARANLQQVIPRDKRRLPCTFQILRRSNSNVDCPVNTEVSTDSARSLRVE